MEELTSCFADQRRGVIAARRALQAADPASGSVPETEARLLFARAGLPRPVTQRVVWADGRCYVLDFAWEEEMLGAEIDGFRYHSATGDYQRDREKQNAVQLGGWFVLRFTVADIRFNGSRTVAQLEEARSFRRRRMS